MTTAEVFATGDKNLIELHRMYLHTIAEHMTEMVFGSERREVACVPGKTGLCMLIGAYTIDYLPAVGYWAIMIDGYNADGGYDFDEVVSKAIMLTVEHWLDRYADRLARRESAVSRQGEVADRISAGEVNRERDDDNAPHN